MITYQALYNQVVPAINNTCVNVVNYWSLPGEMRPGYQNTFYTNRACSTWTIRNPIYQVDTNTVSDDFLHYIRNIRGIDLNANVNPRGLMNFYSAVACFCEVRVRVASAQVMNSHYGRYRVYCRDGGYSNFTTIDPNNDTNLIIASDINTISYNINQIISQNNRAYYVRYSTNLWIR